jgi:hypothetical protein
MPFVEVFLKYKDSFKSVADAINKSNEFFIRNYVKSGKDIKPNEIIDFFSIGSIFSLHHLSKNKESKNDLNGIPIVMVSDIIKKDFGFTILGVDLVKIPPGDRAKILESVFDYVEKNFGKGEKVSLTPSIVKSLVKNSIGYNPNYGISSSSIRNASVVDRKDWEKIPYLTISTLEGSSLNQIYSDYRAKSK